LNHCLAPNVAGVHQPVREDLSGKEGTLQFIRRGMPRLEGLREPLLV
jgi:hypothetical protein